MTAGAEPFASSQEYFSDVVGFLDTAEAAGLEHGALEVRLFHYPKTLARFARVF